MYKVIQIDIDRQDDILRYRCENRLEAIKESHRLYDEESTDYRMYVVKNEDGEIPGEDLETLFEDEEPEFDSWAEMGTCGDTTCPICYCQDEEEEDETN